MEVGVRLMMHGEILPAVASHNHDDYVTIVHC
jgi:hypothetical protein